MSKIPAILLALLLAVGSSARAGRYFKIEVVDDRTGRGVPLVELSTVNDIRYVTDSAGLVAFDEPGLMDQAVFFHVKSHGYEFPADGFGNRGKALRVTPGGSARLAIKRINVAQRLYRVTGGGIYRDSVLLGEKPPIRHPLLNAKVLGSDGVLSAVFRGKIYWFWGDTNRPGYPLGNFHTPGATSRLPADGGLAPEVGVDLDYFLGPKGFAKEAAHMPGEGPTWLSGLTVLGDRSGQERMFAAYAKIRPPMETYQRGLVEFDPERNEFKKVVEFDLDAPTIPFGHPFHHTVDGVEYVYFADPFPVLRVRANPKDLARLDAYEAYTCLKEGTRPEDAQLDRDADGRLRFGWKRGTAPIDQDHEERWIKAGKMRLEEAPLRLADVATGQLIRAHRGSVYWNEYRKRWAMVFCQIGGTSFLGEIWYAESPRLEGPWTAARKIVTHEKYSFYNPKQHPELAEPSGRVIYFEGTYATTFSGNSDPTPRYDYNQIMYRLDLSDPRLGLPGGGKKPGSQPPRGR